MTTNNIDVEIRPRTLEEMTISKSFSNKFYDKFKTGKLQHGYFITGPSGNGKTTLARAIASCIFTGTLDQAYDLNGTMCYEEIDASVNNGVAFIRELVDRIVVPPIGEDKIVILLDEAHYLSKESQSSLLKTLEEPPEHLYIIIVTNEPQKLSTAFKNRCEPISIDAPNGTQLLDYARLYAIPNIVEGMSSKEKTNCNKNITSLTDAKITEIINTSDDKSLRTLCKRIYDFIYSGDIAVTRIIDDNDLGLICESLIFPNKDNWRKNIIETISRNGGKSYDDLRKALCNYISKIYASKFIGLNTQSVSKEDRRYLTAINILKKELIFDMQKSDLMQRMIDISLMNIGLLKHEKYGTL